MKFNLDVFQGNVYLKNYRYTLVEPLSWVTACGSATLKS